MRSIALVVLFAFIACALAEPPRRRFGARKFARQEEDPNAEPAPAQGYDYSAPAERLRLPSRFRQFARQEDAPSSGGYSYPKPTESYGPPEEETTEPSGEYGPPEETTEDAGEEATTPIDDGSSEALRRLQASQYRKKSAKLVRPQKLQKLTAQKIQQQPVLRLQQSQPVYYVDYPTAEFQPQLVYIFK